MSIKILVSALFLFATPALAPIAPMSSAGDLMCQAPDSDTEELLAAPSACANAGRACSVGRNCCSGNCNKGKCR